MNKGEVLRYLGYRGQEITVDIDNLIDLCMEEVINKSKPRYIYKYFDIEEKKNAIEVKDSILVLEGIDIKNHLKGCKKCVILIATLGIEVEKLIILTEKLSLTKALILDACATTYIEEICDKAEEEIKLQEKEKGFNITWRFSPGYGDLSIGIQKDILNVMDANKAIGVMTTSHSILFPRKSVTAIIGISKEKYQNYKKDCSKCNKYESCVFRRGGKGCGVE